MRKLAVALGAGALAFTEPVTVISGTAQAGTRVTTTPAGTPVTGTTPVTQHTAIDPAIRTGTFASTTSASAGELEIITGHGLVQLISDPSGCIGPPAGGYWGPATKVVNDTDHTAYLYTVSRCNGPSTSLPAGESTTGDYSAILAP